MIEWMDKYYLAKMKGNKMSLIGYFMIGDKR